MRTTPSKPMLSTAQQNNINGVLAVYAPGTRYGDMSVARARQQLAGEGFSDTQIDAMLDLRRIEPKVQS